jgi:hypothetical protein
MTQGKHRKEHKIRVSDERKSVKHLGTEETSEAKSDSFQHLRESLAQSNSGKNLDSNLRSELEPQFGHNFENVRVHSDSQADQMAKSINANAFTTGQDVYFREGMFKPETQEGKKLLAHELTHTVQQSGGTSSGDARVKISQTGDTFEQAAHTKANAVMEARGTTIQPASGVQGMLIQREIHDPSSETSTITTPPGASETETASPPATPAADTASVAEFQSATRAFEAGRYLEAAHAFENLASRFPAQQQDLLHNACRAYQELGQDQNLGVRRVERDVLEAAADPANLARARQAATEGVQAYRAHDYARAAQLFLDSYQAVPSPELQFNLGMAALNFRHPADALEAFGLARAGGVHVPQRLIRRAEEERARIHDISERDLEALSGSEADAIDAIVNEASVADAGALFHTATRSFMDRHYEDAVIQYRDIQATLTRAQGRPDVYLLWNEAQARFRAGDYLAATPLFRQALSLR